MTVSIESALLIFGGILFIGYFGELLSKRFMVPSALFLLLVGFLLKAGGYVDMSAIVGIQDLFSALALIVLLFDGGISLHINTILFKSGRVLVMAVLTTVLGLAITALLFMGLGMNPLIGAILGAIAGGIGSVTTISMLKGLSLPESIKSFLTLESSVTDVFSIILALVLTEALISGTIDVQSIGQGIAARFSVGILIGAIAGLVSILALSKIERGYSYMMTFAIVLMLYSVTEFFAGSGAIAVLIFGVLFGNEAAVRKLLNIDHNENELIVKEFQEEVSFFIRTFFFVFLGAVVTLGSVPNFLIALGITLLFYAVRYLSAYASTLNTVLFESKKILTVLSPRGLATAVLATYPLVQVQNAIKMESTPYLQSILLQVSILPEISFYIILLTIIFTTVLVPFIVKNGTGKTEKTQDKKDQAKDES